MNFINIDFKKIFLLAALVAAPLLSVNLQQRSIDRPWILQPFFYISGVTQNAYATFSFGVRGTTKTYLDLIGIKNENDKLKKELSELQAQLGEMAELKLENARFSNLLEFQKRARSKLKAARIIGRDLLPDYKTVTIDKGIQDGVQKGLATITINGVVGYVVHAEPTTAHILLLTDRYAVIDAIVQRSRIRGILHGSTTEKSVLRYLKRNDDVKEGDVIVTSGIDRVFPKGFPIGTVTSVKTDDYGLGQEVDVQPIANPSNLEEVFVILQSAEDDPLITTPVTESASIEGTTLEKPTTDSPVTSKEKAQ